MERISQRVNDFELLSETSENKEKVKITLSIGIAQIGQQDDRFKLIENADDKALYQAKKNGRNQIVVLDED